MKSRRRDRAPRNSRRLEFDIIDEFRVVSAVDSTRALEFTGHLSRVLGKRVFLLFFFCVCVCKNCGVQLRGEKSVEAQKNNADGRDGRGEAPPAAEQTAVGPSFARETLRRPGLVVSRAGRRIVPTAASVPPHVFSCAALLAGRRLGKQERRRRTINPIRYCYARTLNQASIESERERERMNQKRRTLET